MPRYRNRLLRVMTPSQRAMLEPLERVELNAGQIIIQMNEPVTHFIFPHRVLLSYVFILGDGRSADVLTSGATMIGGHTTFQVPESLHQILVRVGGVGWRVPRARLLDAIDRDAALFDRLRALVHIMDRAMARNVACRTEHNVEQRFCRLLLTARDAIESEELQLTVPTFAEMLSVHRDWLSRFARRMAGEGIIGFDRGRRVILRDAATAFARACICYQETAADRRGVLG